MGSRFFQPIPVYPFLVAILPVVHFHETNFRQLEPGDGLRMILLHLVVTGFLMFLGRLVWKDSHRTAMVVALLAVVLFLGNRVGGITTLILSALVVFLGVIFLLRPLDVKRGTIPLNMTVLVLVVMPVVQTVMASRAQVTPVATALFQDPINLKFPRDGSRPPDIYFLVLDGLGQPDYIENNYRLPRKRLAGILEQRGFKVLRHAESNYQQTALSLAATLNIGLVHELLTIPDIKNSDRRALARLVGENRVVRTLKQGGYEVVTFPSGYPLTRLKDPIRRRRPLVAPSFLEYFVIEDGVLPLLQPLLGRGPADLSFAMRRHRLEYVFDHLSQSRDGIPDDQPVFVFSHILAPHPPFVFSRTGEALRSRNTFTFADGNHWTDIHEENGVPYYIMYSEQLTYVMERLGEAIDSILESSPQAPVIIIQGDHGPGSGLHHEKAGQTDHQERFGIFNAWYTPPGVEIDLVEGSTAINTFPTLFNALFEAGLPPQADRRFYARISRPYYYLEMTDMEY